MKWLALSLILFSVESFSRDVIIDIDGVRHLCTPIVDNPGQGYQKCVDTAYRGPFSADESKRLCAGAYDESPAECAIEAYRGVWSKEESIKLCIHASSTGPATCAQVAYNGPFSKAESLDLCSNNGTERRAVCALDAYRGPYSKQESIEICRRVRLTEENKSRGMDKNIIDELIKSANLKAFERKEYK